MKINKIANFINNSQAAQKVLTKISKNPAVFSTTAACITAGIARPLTIAALPMKDKQDKKYSIASSISAGLTELITAPLLFIPFNKALSKSGDTLIKTTSTIFSNNPKMVNSFKSVSNRLFKTAVLPLVSLFRFSVVPPVVKMISGREKKE